MSNATALVMLYICYALVFAPAVTLAAYREHWWWASAFVVLFWFVTPGSVGPVKK